ncbi:MAG: nucleotidyltransferase domain-containing protein [Defluviitaleaceae bacterium]|nr:nucleotidyltransferase domain-containing protein [Defluviitaleaceae bacterium]
MQPLEINSVIFDVKSILSQNPAPVRRIGVFGSLAKGQIHNDSDIDIAIEYEPGESYDFNNFVKFCEICEYLSETISKRYGRKVDIVPVEERSDCLLQEIHDEVVWI